MFEVNLFGDRHPPDLGETAVVRELDTERQHQVQPLREPAGCRTCSTVRTGRAGDTTRDRGTSLAHKPLIRRRDLDFHQDITPMSPVCAPSTGV